MQKRAKFLLLCSVLCIAAGPYTQIASVPLGLPDKWDYVTYDGATKQILVAHATETTVVDAETNSVAGHLGFLNGAHGQVGVGGKIYASSGDTGTVTVFDAASFKKLKTLAAGAGADGVIYDPLSRRVVVVNGKGNSVSFIDPTSFRTETVTTPGKPEAAAADGKGAVFVNLADSEELARLDRGRETARWKLPGCTSPHGLALDPETELVFATCLNGVLLVVDGKTGAVKQALPIGHGTDAAAFDPVRHRVFSSNGDGTLSVFEEKQGALSKLADMPTARGARTMAVDAATGRLYLVTADVSGSLPPGHGGLVPHFAFREGSVKLLVYAPAP